MASEGLTMSLKIRLLLSVCLALAAGVAIYAQNKPGDMTQARVWIENRQPTDAIPVVVETSAVPMRVQIAGTPTVGLDPATTIAARAVRQAWDYRTIAVPTGQDPASLLLTAGNDGWEVAGVLPPGQTGVTLLLKRPR